MQVFIQDLINGYVAETRGSLKFFKDHYAEYIPSVAPDGSIRLHPQKAPVEIAAETLEDLRNYAIIYGAHVIITPTFKVLFTFYKEGEINEDR